LSKEIVFLYEACVAQRLEHWSDMPRVAGSTPAIRIFLINTSKSLITLWSFSVSSKF
jgi:hypothetical protein